MQAHEIPGLDPQPRDAEGHGYVDFLASNKLSVGLAIWPAGSVDRQRPHEEDEVYYVITGRGTIWVADEDRPVRASRLVVGHVAAQAALRAVEEIPKCGRDRHPAGKPHCSGLPQRPPRLRHDDGHRPVAKLVCHLQQVARPVPNHRRYVLELLGPLRCGPRFVGQSFCFHTQETIAFGSLLADKTRRTSRATSTSSRALTTSVGTCAPGALISLSARRFALRVGPISRPRNRKPATAAARTGAEFSPTPPVNTSTSRPFIAAAMAAIRARRR